LQDQIGGREQVEVFWSLTPYKGEKYESYRRKAGIYPKSDRDMGGFIAPGEVHCREIYFWELDNTGRRVFPPFRIS
jgi:hypothetical protein